MHPALADLVPPTASFASDNAAGVHPAVMEALAEANVGTALAYGADRWTAEVEHTFSELFGTEVTVALCWGGTGANVVALQSLLRPWQAVVCTEGAHIAVDECGAIERIVGAKLIDVPGAPGGKLLPGHVSAQLHLMHDEHHVQPAVVSITQSTEYGGLYSVDEIRAVTDVAHEAGMLVHVDGARISNAVAARLMEDPALDAAGALRSITTEAGVDVITFGGTKAGMMYGEAVVFLRPDLGREVRFARKQAGQLPSKMRFVAAQFQALLRDDLWVRLAAGANLRAAELYHAVKTIAGVSVERAPEVNSMFAVLDREAILALQEWSFFWDWDVHLDEVRWMTSWQTTDDDIAAFVAGIRAVVV